MSTRLTMVSVLQCKQILNHDVVHMKLIQLYMSIIPQLKKNLYAKDMYLHGASLGGYKINSSRCICNSDLFPKLQIPPSSRSVFGTSPPDVPQTPLSLRGQKWPSPLPPLHAVSHVKHMGIILSRFLTLITESYQSYLPNLSQISSLSFHSYSTILSHMYPCHDLLFLYFQACPLLTSNLQPE